MSGSDRVEPLCSPRLPCELPPGAPSAAHGGFGTGSLAAQQEFTLRNGLRIQLQPDQDKPYLELRLEVGWPKGEEPPGREGAASILARLLQAGGAGPFDHGALGRTLEERGIGFDFQAGPGFFRWTLQCSSTLQEEAFGLLAHLVARPVFSGSLLETQRARLWRERQSLGLVEWAELRFGWHLVEGRPEGLATERSLSELGLDPLSALHRRLVRPEQATLHLRGDLNLAQARQLALLHLGVWGPAPEPPLPSVPTAKPRVTNPPTCLAVAQGPVAATLALVLPGEPNQEAVELLAELLPRWLEDSPEESATATGQLRRLADGRPCVILKAFGEKGSNPAALLLALRGWAEKLGNRTLTKEDLTIATRLRTSRKAVQSGSFQEVGTAKSAAAAVPTTENLTLALKAWCSPLQQRALLTGAPEIAPDHPALKGLGILEWVRKKE